MAESYSVTIDDGASIPTEDDLKAFSKKIGVTYDEYINALDNGFYKTSDILNYVKKIRNEKN